MEMKMTEKLTAPQRSLLRELPTHVVPEFPPAQKLIALGLAEWADARSTMLNITPAGRTALAKSEGRS